MLARALTPVESPPHSSMGLPTGTRLGPYEIVAQIGGGMGEVYRARDSRLEYLYDFRRRRGRCWHGWKPVRSLKSCARRDFG